MFRSLTFALLLVPVVALAQHAPPDDMVAFDKDLDALFVGGGLTANQAAARAAHTSPTVLRRAAEVRAAIAQGEQAELAQVPIVKASASYTRLSHIPSVMF